MHLKTHSPHISSLSGITFLPLHATFLPLPSRRRGLAYAFCYILDSSMRPLPACAASHRRVCTVLCERGPGSCTEKPRSILSSSVARCTLSASRRLHELKILDGALAEPTPYPSSCSVRMSAGAWEGRGWRRGLRPHSVFYLNSRV